VFDVETRCFQESVIAIDDHVSAEGRVMEVLSEHNCQGWLEGYVLTGRHGLFATYEAFALIIASMATQHAKWLDVTARLAWRTPVPSLNYLLTSTCWRNDHNGPSHQGPGFMDTITSKKGTVARGASIWAWAGSQAGGDPDVILACAGDVPTLETIAAAAWLRTHAPALRLRAAGGERGRSDAPVLTA
jgi:xylulose-5-phosphate/fructose-6-phosphate phosphoketolase